MKKQNFGFSQFGINGSGLGFNRKFHMGTLWWFSRRIQPLELKEKVGAFVFNSVAVLCQEAVLEYQKNRGNGAIEDTPQSEFPMDGKFEWKTPNVKRSHVKYVEGLKDRAWMEEQDRNYISRLVQKRINRDLLIPQELTDIEEGMCHPDIVERIISEVGALNLAVINNDKIKLEELLVSGMNVNQADKTGRTPLFIAVSEGYVPAIEVLLKADANINQADKKGRTPLFIAAYVGQKKATDILLEKPNINVYLKTHPGSEEWASKTAQEAAQKKGYHDIVNALTKFQKQNFSKFFLAAEEGNEKFLCELLKIGVDVNQARNDGYTALYIAAVKGHEKVFKILQEAGADVNHVSSQAASLLHIAIRKGDDKTLNLLLKAGAKVDQVDQDGVTPLCLAAKNGFEKAINELIKAGADVNWTQKNGKSPLFIAAENNHERTFEILQTAGANVNHVSSQAASLLHLAVQNNHGKTLNFLLKADAKVDQVDQDGIGPLWLAAQNGQKDAIVLLLKAGANVNLAQKDGKTPLFIAAENGHEEAAKALLAAPDIYLNLKTRPGNESWADKTALERAWQQGNHVIGNLIAATEREQQMSSKKKGTKKEKQTNVLTATTKSSKESSSNNAGYITLSFAIKPEELTMNEKIGEGSFSVVYHGKYRFMDVAVKELKTLSISSDALQEFKNEVDIMAKIQSSYITRLYGACLTSPYRLVMEYLPKGSLYSVLHSNTPLGWEQRYQISLDMSIGLAHLHQENILHRDLKSLNVLLDAHYRSKLTDFGLSKMKLETASSTQHKEGSAGTLLWMAPELFQRRAKHTKETDIYSLGMVFWEMAARALPFQDAPSPSVVPTWIKDGEREDIPKDCPLEFGQLIQQCWAQDPHRRPALTIIIAQLQNLVNTLKRVDQSESNPQYTGSTLFKNESSTSGAGQYLGNLESGYSPNHEASASTSDYMDNLASHRPRPS